MSTFAEDKADHLGRQGPKWGIHMSRASAEDLFAKYIRKEIAQFTDLNRGYNNRLYFVITTDSMEYVLKISGRYWNGVKTKNEIASLQLVTAFSSIPVPRVVVWSSDKSEYGVEYIVMEKMDGIPLGDIWEYLTLTQAKECIKQLAGIIVEMKTKISIELKQRRLLEQIGNFGFEGGRDSLDMVRVGKTLDLLGPWISYKEYMRELLNQEIEIMQSDAIYVSLRELLPRIKSFIALTLNKPELELVVNDYVFTHGDLNLSNILVNYTHHNTSDILHKVQVSEVILKPISDSTLNITSILDWEWCGSFPAQDEYLSSYDFLSSEHSSNLTSVELVELSECFYSALEEGGVATPRTIPNYDILRDILEMKDAIAPWYLRDLDDPTSKSTQDMLVQCKKEIVNLLEKYHC
ncbi:uncharacterized protein VTP21DRAFT_5803 [Calcarisporiella thermophila]|uniref:uncharacterized protein n=1 Tax=Calcarisporiella thermophila TaxID=911321 RepID=UPI003742801B